MPKSLEWPFLFNILEAFNFPAEIIHLIQILYKCPKAKIYTNSTLSDEIAFERAQDRDVSSPPSCLHWQLNRLQKELDRTQK
ncbi:unnamed protein product [Oncorhynchus mykiss]|uniref:Uncharacterized protein n=1 Tax=Oncorhynchus mykiss TaxID=8022 RepID=A0A060YKR3_ONCMY|nr:unnamed protein product [Oncorhynchus mykiss]